MEKKAERVIVVGGGAAGMMAAIAAADTAASVTLLEQNEKLGKKLFITGKGRCNVTNAAPIEKLFENVCSNAKFLYSAFYGFDNNAVMDFLEGAGCPLKTERGERVFPVSDHSSDIIAALVRELKKRGVEILLNTGVKTLLTEDYTPLDAKSKQTKRMVGVELWDGRNQFADAVILCTGGLSYPSTGSTGDGHRFAEGTGHRMVACSPSLVPLKAGETWCRDLMGLSLRNVQLTMYREGRKVFCGQGEMLFTHFGVSGPLVLSASCYYGKTKPGEKVTLSIDLKPALEEEQLDKRLLRDFEKNVNRQFKNALDELFPSKMIPVMVSLSGIDPEKRVHEITRDERKAFASIIKNLPLTVTGTGSFAEAIVTRGGVSVKDVNPSTMESRIVSGLFFAGELLDLDAYTGGFNLQIAWSTGYLAGRSAGGRKNEL